MNEYIIPGLLIWGLLGGFMGGLLGIGGGLIFVLVIPEAARQLGVPEESIVPVTIANSLACTFITTFSTGIRHFSARADIRKSALITGFTATLVSILVLKFIVNPGHLSPKVFHYLFISMLVYLSGRMLLQLRKDQSLPPVSARQGTGNLVLTGLLAGLVSPLSGLGGGVVVVPFLHAVLHFPIASAQAISLNVIAISTLISTVFNMNGPGMHLRVDTSGLIIWPLVFSLGPLAAMSSILGNRIASRMKPAWSGGIFFLFLLFILLRKIISPY